MKIFFTLLILAVTINTSFCQDIDKSYITYDTLSDIIWCRNSIEKNIVKVSKSKSDTINIETYLDICAKYMFFRKDSSIFYASKAYQIAKKINYNRGIMRSLYQLSNIQLMLGNNYESIKSGHELLEFAENIKDTIFTIGALFEIGNIYVQLKEYEKELNIYRKILIVAKVYSNKLLADIVMLGAYNGICDAYLNLNKLDSSSIFNKLAYDLSLLGGNLEPLIPIINYGEINYKLKDFKRALTYYRKGLELYNLVDNDRILKINILQSIGNTFYNLKLIDSSIIYLKAAFSLSIHANNFNGILKSSELLADIYSDENIFDSAFFYQKHFIEAKDTLYNQDKIKLIDNFSYQEKLRQNEKQEAIAKAHGERIKRIKIGIIAVLVPMFATIVFYISKRKKRNDKVISTLGVVSLLMFFEFVSLLINPFVEKITNREVLLSYLVSICLALILAPAHRGITSFFKKEILKVSK